MGFRGWIGAFTSRRVGGWVMNELAPQSRIRLFARIGNFKLGPFVADEFRDHLTQRGIGDGKYGFSITVPTNIDLRAHERIEIVEESSQEVLLRLDRTDIDFQKFSQELKEVNSFKISEPARSSRSNLDSKSEASGSKARRFDGWSGCFSGRKVSGWIVDRKTPSSRVAIRVKVNEYLSPLIEADEHRDHLIEKGIDDGLHGFTFIIPDHVDLSKNPEVDLLLDDGQSTGIKVSDTKKLLQERGSTFRAPKRAGFPREKQDDRVLLWCPISTSGLTTQLEQTTKILRSLGVKYCISYHVAPTIAHKEKEHWIDPSEIDRVKLVIFFERFVPFDRGFEAATKVFYLNLDWLQDKATPLIRTHADIILCPTPYKLEDIQEKFPQQKVLYLPWPALFEPQPPQEEARDSFERPIRLLYMGNDYDKGSRKSPLAVVDAILSLQRSDLRFTLKFRSPLPPDVRAKLEASIVVEQIIDRPISFDEVEALHRRSDISLIPNECEGNGLSILEAWALNVIPAVLNGHPMKDVVSEQNSFLIDCEQTGWTEQAPRYKTSKASLLSFFNSLSADAIQARKEGLFSANRELVERQSKLEDTISDLVSIAGIRTKKTRASVDSARNLSMNSSDIRALDQLIFSDTARSKYASPTELIDVIITTSRRPQFFRQSFRRLRWAMDASPFQHRLFVSVDGMDTETLDIIRENSHYIHQVLWTNERLGLPYGWNATLDLVANTINRTEKRPDYICYIQDDCHIVDVEEYFTALAEIADSCDPGLLGYVSGYYTAVHPGFAETVRNGRRLIYSDSIDGKNFMGRPRTIESIGRLTWHFSDGMRRGNPGPDRGSHFDLWQWKESPNSLLRQGKTNLVLPELTTHLAKKPHESTWENDTTDENVKKRIEAGRIYK